MAVRVLPLAVQIVVLCVLMTTTSIGLFAASAVSVVCAVLTQIYLRRRARA